jgi:hypothetical protein
VRKVGELLLQFEQERAAEPRTPPVAVVPAPAPDGPFDGGLEPAVEVRPPAEPRGPAGELPGRSVSAPSASRFRCPTCRIFVVPTAAGTCPKCGRPPPRMLELPVDAPPPATTEKPGWGGRVLGLAIAVVASAVGVWLGGHLASRACGKEEPSSAVEGPYEARPVGMRLTFERGWRRIETVDSSEVAGMFTQQMMFFRGGTSADPEVGLLLGTATPGWLPIALDDLSSAEFRAVVEGGAQGMKRGAKSGLNLDPRECEVVRLGGQRVGRCAGRAQTAESRELLVYIWVQGKKIALAMFFSRLELGVTQAEADRMIASVRPL